MDAITFLILLWRIACIPVAKLAKYVGTVVVYAGAHVNSVGNKECVKVLRSLIWKTKVSHWCTFADDSPMPNVLCQA